MSELLDQYRKLREERLRSETKRKQAAAGLLVSGLQQRLLSSIEAFARTLRVHRHTVERLRAGELADAAAPPARSASFDLLGGGVGSDDDRATLSEEERQEEEESQFEAATRATAGPTDSPPAKRLLHEEQKLLDQMTEIAEVSRSL